MTCLGDDTVVALVEGRLEATARAQAEQHLDDCAACRQLVAHSVNALVPTAVDPAARGEPTTSATLRPGARIDRYEVLRAVGTGAMGVVYAAEDLELRRRVALKVVRPGGSGGDAQLRGRLLREARAASAVRHPNVVTVHDVIALGDGSPVVVMDLLEGETLRARLLREGRLGVRAAVAVVVPVLAALEAAHALGVVHRDLKPDNVFLARTASGDEEVKIVDFGIAKLTSIDGPAAASTGLTETGMLIGTPHYMAPEQAFAEGEVDARADLWAVGVILYECLGGERPVDGESMGQVLKRLARLEIRPLGGHAPHVPAALAELVHRLLVERDVRTASAAEVRAELERFRDHDDTGAPARPSRPTASSSAALGGSDAGVALDVREKRPGRALALGLLAVALGALGWWQLRPTSPPDPLSVNGEGAKPLETTSPLPSGSEPATSPTSIPEPVSVSGDGAKQPTRISPLPSGRGAGAEVGPVRAAPTAAPDASDGPAKLLTKPPF